MTIKTTEEFDAASVNVDTLRFGTPAVVEAGGGAPRPTAGT